ncbi:MAG: helix-turn-helix domain-containing protein [Halobacteriaceae archaeon]
MREAVIHLSDDELESMGFAEVVAETRAAGLVDVTELVCHGAGGILEVRVEEPLDPDALDGFDAVPWWERLAADTEGVTYLMKVEPTTEDAESIEEHATAHDVTAVTEDGIDLSVVGSDAEIGDSVAAIDDADVSPSLRRLTDFEGTPEDVGDRLTDRQREIVETAYGLGYYEIPRAATTDEVADAVGVTPSTVAEHLQRAERNLISHIVASPR